MKNISKTFLIEDIKTNFAEATDDVLLNIIRKARYIINKENPDLVGKYHIVFKLSKLEEV